MKQIIPLLTLTLIALSLVGIIIWLSYKLGKSRSLSHGDSNKTGSESFEAAIKYRKTAKPADIKLPKKIGNGAPDDLVEDVRQMVVEAVARRLLENPQCPSGNEL